MIDRNRLENLRAHVNAGGKLDNGNGLELLAEVELLNNEPQLGLASNEKLLTELRARIEVHFPGGLEYRTYDLDEYRTSRR